MMIIRKKIVFALSMLLIIGSAVFVQSAVAFWDNDQNILTQVIYKDGTDNEIALDLDIDLTTVDLENVGNQEFYRANYGLSSFATGTTWTDLQLAFVGRGPADTIYFSTTKETAPDIGTTSFTACSGALTGAVQGGYSIAGTNPAVIAAASATGNSYYSGQNSNGNVAGFFAGLNAGYSDGQYGEASLAPLDTDGGSVDMYLYRVVKSGRSAALEEGTATPYVAIVRLVREGDEIVTIMNPGEDTPTDTDGDGVADDEDLCPDTPAGTTVDEDGCPLDTDGDGVPDDEDQCADTPSGTTVDETGCAVVVDSDGDGVADDDDLCADTPEGTTVDATGCPLDTDGDGVADDDDLCADTPTGTTVDEDGCALDTDGDGVPDDDDQCDNTASGATVDEDGCSTADADGDGITDDKDECADTASGTEVDDVGCAVTSDDDDDDDDDSDLCFISSMLD